MNKHYFFLLAICLLGCQTQDKIPGEIVGKWSLSQITIFDENHTSDLNPNNDRWLELKADGTFLSGGTVGRNTGKYAIEDNILHLDSDAGENDDSDWKITVSSDTLIMTGVGTERQESSKVISIKMDPNEPAISFSETSVNSSIRALEISSDGTAWFAGSKGVYGQSKDGSNWIIDSIAYEEMKPEFRSLAITSEAVHLLSVASPALLYRSVDMGQTWNLVYTETDSLVFYDSMEFWDEKDGIAVGDVMNGCLSIITTNDGGLTWSKIPCSDLPEALEGEGCFAASDTNIGLYGDHVWIGTTKARVYHSSDRGKTWEIQDTPIIQGKVMTGIFSLSFLDENNGIVFGGDWEEKDNQTKNKAITTDGGKTWSLISDGRLPGYRSCVKYEPGSDGQKIWAAGIPGLSFSDDGGQNWIQVSDANYYTMRFNKDGRSGFIAGRNKVSRFIID